MPLKPLPLLHALVLALAALAGAAQADPRPPLQPWGHELAQRAPDPAVRFGTLPNGMRYAVMHNETPKDGVAMRLRIGSGSLQERDDEQGLAHLLEHMAFRGSAGVADGEVIRLLERQGLRFGPDSNAFTGHDQTVYTFTFPRHDAAALDTGLTLFREIASRLKLDAVALDAEKGVVLSEERSRDVPPFRALKLELGSVLAGTRAPQRWPIGLASTLKAATPEKLQRYYRAHYRPDNATLVVVGNVDVAAVVRQIEQGFADWTPQGEPDALALGSARPEVAAVEAVEPGLPERVALHWVSPPDRRPATEAVERERALNGLALMVLNLRLADRALKAGSPYVGASAGSADALLGVADSTQLQVLASGERWGEALDAVTEEARLLLRDGVQPDDLKRALGALRAALKAAVDRAPTRQSAQIADALVGSAATPRVFSSAEQDLAWAGPLLDQVTPAQVTAALRQAFAGQGPVLFRSAQTGAVTPPVLQQRLAAAMTRPLPERVAAASVSWPYTDFGAAGRVLSTQVDEALGASVVQFANGTRLVVKRTDFAKDKIDVRVALGGGRSATPAALAPALWTVSAFTLGGMARMPLSDLQKWLQVGGRVLTANLGPSTSAFVLTGATRPADLDAQLQVLAAFARDPGFRPEAAEKVKALAPMIAGQVGTLPAAVFGRARDRLLSGNDERLIDTPDEAQLRATTGDELPLLLRGALQGAADVVIVGDVTVERAVQAVQATFGAGDTRPREAVPVLRVDPAANLRGEHLVKHRGRADQGVTGRFWPMPDLWADPALASQARVAAAVLQSRLQETVREKLGITYSPDASAAASGDVAGLGHFSATVETPPDKFATFHAVLDEQLRALAAAPVSADELERARKPLVEARLKQLEQNGFWAGTLLDQLREPRLRALHLSAVDRLNAVTAAQVQALVATRLAGQPSARIDAVADLAR